MEENTNPPQDSPAEAPESTPMHIFALRTTSNREDQVLSLGEIAQGPPKDLLARPQRVQVRPVEEVDPQFERPLDEGPGIGLAEDPGMVSSRRQAPRPTSSHA